MLMCRRNEPPEAGAKMSHPIPLRDFYGRAVDSLRVSVTWKCNYRCIFCHAEGAEEYRKQDVFDPTDYGFIARTLSKYGVRYYKLTGGEPLLRDDIHEIISWMKKYASEVSLVTNGSLLAGKAELLARSGLDRLNVSLHSLREDVYEQITGGSKLLSSVLEGIDKALKHGLKVKINFLLLRSNIPEFPQIIDFASSRGLDVNVIELEPVGVPAEIFKKEYVPVVEVLDYLEKVSTHKYSRSFQNRPTYVLPGGSKVEVVVGFQNKLLCSACTRMRLTHDGFFKTCLYVDDPKINIVDAVKRRSEEELLKLFKEAVYRRKPFFT